MKRTISLFLILVMLLPGMTKMGIVLDFKIHQDFIAATLCIEKDEPESTCNGNCHLSDQIEKIEEGEQKNHPNKLEQIAETLPFLVHEIESMNAPIIKTLVQGTFHKDSPLYSSSHLTRVFHPPEVLINLI